MSGQGFLQVLKPSVSVNAVFARRSTGVLQIGSRSRHGSQSSSSATAPPNVAYARKRCPWLGVRAERRYCSQRWNDMGSSPFPGWSVIEWERHRGRAQTERRGGAGPVRGLLGGKDLTGRLFFRSQ